MAVKYYFDDNNFYTINGSEPKLSFDAIPIVAYPSNLFRQSLIIINNFCVWI